MCRRVDMRESGFSITEILVALTLTTIVMSAVFGLLYRGQESFRREPEVAEVNTNSRSGLDMIARDVHQAGSGTPATLAVLWADGGGNNPDSITILFQDPDIPTCRPVPCGAGPCMTINDSSTIMVDSTTFDPPQTNPDQAYSDGMILFGLETADCNGDGQIGIYPFEVTQDPTCTGVGCSTVSVNHNPGNGIAGLNQPQGFNEQLKPDCTVIGRFRAIQYRINPPPPTQSPSLERRDLGNAEPWIPVARNIENLQFQYGIGSNGDPTIDNPTLPSFSDPETWVTRVRVITAGRSESRNLQGASAGVFDQADTFVRQTFSTLVNLRNVSAQSSSGGGSYN